MDALTISVDPESIRYVHILSSNAVVCRPPMMGDDGDLACDVDDTRIIVALLDSSGSVLMDTAHQSFWCHLRSQPPLPPSQ